MSNTVEILGSVSPTAQGVGRAADLIAALAPPSDVKTDAALVKSEPKQSVKDAAFKLVPHVIGAAAGALLVPSHRLLGAIGGHALATTAMPIMRGGAGRKRAFCQLAVEGAGIAGALLWEEHPFVGFVAGLALGGVATSFVDGSPAQEAWKKFRASK